MKLWIRFVVIFAHLVLIGSLIGPCSRSGCRFSMPTMRRADQPDDAEGDVQTAAEPPMKAPREAGHLQSPGWPQPAPAKERAIFSKDFFTAAGRSLPDDLAVKTDVCRTGVVVDWSARRMLWGKNERKAVPIASLTKMMTVLLLTEALEERDDLSLDKQISVSRSASQIGGRQVWLDPRETFSIEDLLRCVLIHSANDAAFQIAEIVAGSEDVFVTRMQKRASELGLSSFTFHNSHGLPAGPTRDENMGSALQVAFLAGLLMKHDVVTEWSGTRLSYLGPRLNGKKTQLLNTNKLVGRTPGVNGMKTGYTHKSGYCLAATCDRADRQVVVVVTGCQRGSKRDDLVAGLLEWAYSNP